MDLYGSQTYRGDLEKAADSMPFLDELRNASVLVTGASGLICSAVTDLLLWYNESRNAGITVYAAGRSESGFRRRFRSYSERNDLVFVPYDTAGAVEFDFYADYIIHGAGNAHPAAISSEPVETMLDNFMGMRGLLEYAREVLAKRVLFISSSEVYGKKNTLEPFSEEEYGYVDLLNLRASYPVSKRAAETLCVSYGAEYGMDTVIVRPGHIYGPTASERDSRVSSVFAYDALEGRDLVLKSDGSQIRSYCYVLDCASAIISVLLRGKSGEAYNISNPASVMTIREMAEGFAKAGNVNVRFETPDSREKSAFNPMNNSSLRSDKLQEIGWRGLFDARTGTEHTIRIMAEAANDAENTLKEI